MNPFDKKQNIQELEPIAKLRAVLRDCVSALTSLRDVWSREIKKLPLPMGIFVGDADRAQSHAAVCRLMIAVQSPDVRLRDAIARLVAVDREFSACLVSGEALEIEPIVTLWKTYQAVRDAWMEFYRGAVTVYAEKLCTAADMENEGASCDPYSVSGLGGEFVACADAFLTRVRKELTI